MATLARIAAWVLAIASNLGLRTRDTRSPPGLHRRTLSTVSVHMARQHIPTVEGPLADFTMIARIAPRALVGHGEDM
jgi:hypothetical protein